MTSLLLWNSKKLTTTTIHVEENNWKSDVNICVQSHSVIQVQAANPGKSTSNSPSNVFNIHVEKSLRSLNVSYGISIFLFELENCILISIDPCGSSGWISNYDLYHSIITWLEGGVEKKKVFLCLFRAPLHTLHVVDKKQTFERTFKYLILQMCVHE